MHRPRRARASFLPSLLLLPLFASAAKEESTRQPCQKQQPPEEELFRPATSGPFVAFTALLPPLGKVVAQPILSFGTQRATLGPTGEILSSLPGESFRVATLTLFVEVPVHPRLALGGQGSLLYARRTRSGQEAVTTGFGDALLFARGVLLRETRGVVPETVLLAQVELPTGPAESRDPQTLEANARVTGSVDFISGLNLTKGVWPVLVHADILLALALPARAGGADIRYAPTFAWSLAAEWPLGAERLALMLEVSGSHQGPPTRGSARQEDARVDELVAGAGLELLLGSNMQLLVGFQRTLWGRNVSAFDTLLLTLVPTLPLF